jgi:hypothetical protein
MALAYKHNIDEAEFFNGTSGGIFGISIDKTKYSCWFQETI